MSDYLVACTPPAQSSGGWDCSQIPPDPYTSFTSYAFPKTLHEGFRWIERMVLRNGHYIQAIRRLVAYFITEPVIAAKDGSDKIGEEEKTKYRDLLWGTLRGAEKLLMYGTDWLIYGNTMLSPLQRTESRLTCRTCGFTQPFERVAEAEACNLSFVNWEYQATCIRCRRHGVWNRNDSKIPGPDGLWIKRWSPYEVNLSYSTCNDLSQYFWAIPEHVRSAIRAPGSGKWWELQNAPDEVVQSVRKNRVMRLRANLVYHARYSAPAGVDTRGWGFSPVLANFSQSWYYQVLSRANETLASGYAVPMPLLTPAAAGQGQMAGDPLYANYNPQDFAAQVDAMAKRHRRAPNGMYTLPVPVNFQLLGGDLSKIIPEEQLEAALARLLDCIGIPIQLYRGDLTMESAIPAMRLHEAYQAPLVDMLNGCLQMMADAASELLQWEPVKVTLKKVSHADDVSRTATVMQLMLNQKVSETTAMGLLGINAGDERRRIIEDQISNAKLQAEAQQTLTEQDQMQQLARSPGDPMLIPLQQAMATMAPPADPSQAGGAAPPAVGGPPPTDPAAAAAPPAGGMPAGPPGMAAQFNATSGVGNNTPMTVEELSDKATGIAQLVVTWPDAQRKSYLISLKRREPQLHAIVSSVIDDMEQGAATQGKDMVMQQQYGAPPPA